MLLAAARVVGCIGRDGLAFDLTAVRAEFDGRYLKAVVPRRLNDGN